MVLVCLAALGGCLDLVGFDGTDNAAQAPVNADALAVLSTSSSSSHENVSAPTSTSTDAVATSTTTLDAGDHDRVARQVSSLVVADRAAPEPYRRARFGDGWTDDDHDCHDTRAEVLMRESTGPVGFRANGCTVDSGVWVDPWNGSTSLLASTFQIDHTVPLANAWVAGAWQWSDDDRLRFANDLENPDALRPLEGADNNTKSDKTPDQWKPPLRYAWCHYADTWSRIKLKWSLTVTKAEQAALAEMAQTCLS